MDRTLRIGRFKNIIHVAFIFLLLISWQSVGYSEEVSRSVTYSAEFKPLGDGIDWETSIPADFDPIFLQFKFKVDPGTLTSEINGNIIFDQDNQTLSVKPRVITDSSGNSFAGKLENSASVLLSGEVVYDITIPIPIFPDITLNGAALIPGFPHIDVGWHDEAFFNTFLLGTNESVEVKGGVRKLVSADVTAVEIAELLAIALSQGTLPQKIADKAGDILKKYIGDGGIKINGGLETRFVFSSSGIYVDGQLITRDNQTVTAAGLNTALSSYSIHSSFEEALSVALYFILSSDIFFKFAPFNIELWSYEKEIGAAEIPLVPKISVNIFDFTTSPDPITFPVQAQDVTTPNQTPIAVGSITNETLQVGGSSTPIDISSKFNDPDNDTLTYNSTSSDSTVATAQIVGSQMTVYAWSAGSATITITTTDPEGLQATQTFTVTVQPSTTTVNRTPVVEGTISTRSLYVDGVSSTIDVSIFFSDPDGDNLTYNATSNNTRVATVEELGGSRIRISPTGNGSATVTVTANDGSLSATQSFTVNVSTLLILGNRSPIAQGTISSQTLTAGNASTTINVSSYFRDPDGDTLTYTVASSDDDVVSVQRTGSSSIRLTPEDGGSATVTVTASDSRLSITQTFSVTVSPSNVESSDSSDVVVENISADYVNNYPGEGYTVSVTVRNAGGRRAPGAHLRYYHSSDDTYSTDDEEYENLDDDLGILDSGETKRENVHLKAPDKQGSFYIIARVARIRNERNTSNNYAAIKITVLPPKTPDLVISVTAWGRRITPASNNNYLIDPNRYFKLDAIVRNQGEEDAPSTTVRYYFSTDTIISDDDEEIDTDTTINRLRKGRPSYERSDGLRAPQKPGDYYYYASVDSVEGEGDTSNNYSEVIKVSVRGPDLIIDSVSVDYILYRYVTVEPNGFLRLLATVKNQGTDEASSTTLRYYVSSDATLSDDDTEFNTDRVHSLDPNETEDEQSNMTQINYVSGVFYCFVCVDSVAGEITPDNNCSEPIQIRVRNVPPVANGTIAALTLRVGEPKSVDVSQAFTDINKDTLTYDASSSDNNIATVATTQSQVTITPKGIGSATITVTASDSEFSATQTISVSVAAQNQAPIAIGTISARTMAVGDISEQIDVSSNFQDADGDTLIYTVTSSNTSVATVSASVSNAQVTITAVAAGSATITVTASDGKLTGTQVISVNVEEPNRAPVAIGTISARTLKVGDTSEQVDVSSNFQDADGDTLTYAVTSNNTSVATVSVSDFQVSLTPVGSGSATITVTASDGVLTATQTISVTVTAASVGNRVPVTVGTISAQTLSVGGSPVVVDVSGNFQDPDGDTLTYSTSSDNNSVATVSISGSQVSLIPVGSGNATITVTASDGVLTATQTISVTVTAASVGNRAPVAIGTISTPTLTVGDPPISINVSGNFQDPDNDNLKYSVNSSAAGVATVSAVGSQMTITAVGAGSATITITASDGKLNATQTIAVTVSSAGPVSGVDWMPDVNLLPAVRAALGLQEGEVLTQEAMLRLTFLNSSSSSIEDLTGLEHATNLTHLYLEANKISDISPIGNLTNLKRLILDTNQINDVSSLANLINLTGLRLNSNKISDISPIENLTNLTLLTLHANKISDISPIENLTNLKSLGLLQNQISNINAVENLTNLTFLTFSENQISNISAVGKLTNLTTLSLAANQVSDISAVGKLTALTWLALSANQVSDISPLKNLTSLTYLGLTTNKISDISPIEKLTSLSSLYLSGNPITDYGPLRRLQAKTTQDISIDVDIGAAPSAPVVPAKTALLPNYPNPFNPETWIPYQLAKPAEVTLIIYDMRGVVVRRLALGHRAASVYRSRNRAAHWDGRNTIGEKVATGVYFVKFTAGDYTATRKMLILK